MIATTLSTVSAKEDAELMIDVTPVTFTKSTVASVADDVFVSWIVSTFEIVGAIEPAFRLAVSVSEPAPPLMVSPEFSV